MSVSLTRYQSELNNFFAKKDPSGELSAVYTSTLEFCNKHIIEPNLDYKMTMANAFEQSLWPAMGEAGILGAMMPVEYGGSGYGFKQFYAIISALSCSPSTALNVVAHKNLCAGRIAEHGNDEQKEKYLPGLISGKLVGSLAMSEPHAGSDVMAMKTTAVPTKDGDGYIINGDKLWITNAPHADVFVVYAKTGNTDKKANSLTAFIIEKDTPGFTVGEKLDKIGMRGSETAPLRFNQCRLPESAVLKGFNQGTSVLFPGLRDERLSLAYIGDGTIRHCLDETVDYVGQRQQFNKPLSAFQGVSFPLAEDQTMLKTLQLMLWNGSEMADDHSPEWTDAAAAEIFLTSSQATNKITMDCILAGGGMGYTHDMRAGRAHMDGILLSIGGGAQNIQRTIIGRSMFPR